MSSLIPILENDLLLRVARGEQTHRPPVWMMRQAGRILPEYRVVRSRLSGFIELCTTPELAAEVTLQPVDLLDVDAAIIFSDILVIPEAMGLKYEMEEKKGPIFPNIIRQKSDIDALRSGEAAAEALEYVYRAVEIASKNLHGRVPLIGFAGAPWTILAYMVQGSGSKTFDKARRFLYAEPALAHQLLQKITDTTIAYLKLKIASGCHLAQIFDSWAGILSPELYRTFSASYINQIVAAIAPLVPVTVFAKGAWFALADFDQMPCSVIGLDWNTSPSFARSIVGNERVLQGNLDPAALYGTPEQVANETTAMLQQFGRHHIANLGHGVYPDTPLDAVKSFIATVKGYQY